MKKILFTLVCLYLSFFLCEAQNCNGSLGAPVVNITFGSGSSNPGPQLSTLVPGASTNYQYANYATGTPPTVINDGDYALVNQVPGNSAWYTGATDHTGNLNGYMAYFNSAPTPGEFYKQTVSSLCPGTTYEFAAWVANAINPSVLPNAILPNITFNILDATTQNLLGTYNTGDISNSNSFTWKQYSFLFTLPSGTNSVTLVLANNNIGGNAQPGNDLAIDDITFKPCGPLTSASFSNTSLLDSTGASTCKTIDLFGKITGSFNSPSYQWQVSKDGGTSYIGIAGATTLNSIFGNYTNGNYLFRMLSAENGNINSPNCRFISNLLKLSVTGCSPTTIINEYTPVLSLDICTNKIIVEDASKYNAGDTVLIIQMKGAEIDSSNTAAFGKITNYKSAGNYEFNYVKSKAGNAIELKDSITRSYDVPAGKVQLIRVPYFASASFTSVLTSLPWDGNKGGVLVLNAKNAVTLQADIDVSGKGFHGGNSANPHSNTLYCFENNYSYPASSVAISAAKGESIAAISDNISLGKGFAGNGGGGGLGHNSGGGGGANGGTGGFGGYQLDACGNAPFDNRGIGAASLNYSNAQNKIFMGGGGGAGHTDQINGSDMQGGNGGGIVIINTPTLNANGFNIITNGSNAPQCFSPGTADCHDGNGGGGGGGTILINTSNYTANTALIATGGKGADLSVYDPSIGANRIGPGGGGGAGTIWLSSPSLPPVISNTLTAGLNGVILGDSNNPWGATAGQAGTNLFNLSLPFDTKPFKKNIDSVRIKVASTSCSSFIFTGLAYVENNPVKTWHWDFDDGFTANTAVVTHTFGSIGSHDVSLVITDANGCTDSVKTSVASVGSVIDFSYSQAVCNPLSIQFSAIGNAPVNPSWTFGDGGLATGISPTHLYSNTGNYIVKYTAQNGGCNDTITKNISVNIIRQDIILTKDTTICFGTAKQLLTAPSLNFCWSPTTYLDDPLSANPITNTPVAITYLFTAQIPGVNAIVNGDFSAGNTGFASDYNFATPNIAEAQYFVGTNPQIWNGALSACSDHTTGNGNMMLINGAPTANVLVWSESVAVTPNTNYAFSTWIQALYPPNPAQLSFSINGGDVGTLITASLPTCTWTQFYITWNSGNNTSAKIAIVNKNTFVQGNDFALDDISFAPVLIKRDSVIITVDRPLVKASNDTAICAGKAVQLNANGSLSYNWSPVAGLSNATIANPVATPSINTQYIVTGTDNKGCTATDTVTITAKTLPIVIVTPDTAICKNTQLQLQATGGSTYQWLPASTLSNASISNPIASPVTSTTFVVVVTAANNCTATDSVKVAINPDPVFTISAADTTCLNTSAQLLATGGDVYTWSPVSLVSNPNIANPTTTAISNTTYTVVIKELTCNNTATLTTSIAVLPVPSIKATKLNDIDCSISAAQLQATGTGQFSWSPAASLDNSTVANPLASPNVTTLYTVSAVDFTTNCVATDTITVVVNKIGATSFFIPSAFTPNGDGLNDCFKVSHFTFMKSVEVSIFNRYGSIVFHSTTDNDCWNGTYRGKAADAGNYVYYIKAEDNCSKFYKKGNLILIR